MTNTAGNPGNARAVAAWHADHVAFGRLLDLLDREVIAFHEAGQPNYPLMFDILQYLHEYVDRSHHPREDVAFARLAQRQPSLQLQVARRLQEHRVIAAAGERLVALLNEIMNGDLMARADVERAAATYLVYYRHHLRAEEELVIPQAVALLRREDWSEVAAAGTGAADPLTAEGIDVRYSELRRELGTAGKAPMR
jgi:hemerythrin-like domain-containing protein